MPAPPGTRGTWLAGRRRLLRVDVTRAAPPPDLGAVGRPVDVHVLVFVAQVPVPLVPGREPQLAHRAVHRAHRRHLLLSRRRHLQPASAADRMTSAVLAVSFRPGQGCRRPAQQSPSRDREPRRRRDGQPAIETTILPRASPFASWRRPSVARSSGSTEVTSTASVPAAACSASRAISAAVTCARTFPPVRPAAASASPSAAPSPLTTTPPVATAASGNVPAVYATRSISASTPSGYTARTCSATGAAV